LGARREEALRTTLEDETMRVSWLKGLIYSTVLISGIGCEDKTHVVGALADGSTGIEDASARGKEDASNGIPAGCNLPPCMVRLFGACWPSGNCVRQNVDLSSYYCYGNGVEIASVTPSLDLTAATVTASKNGATCWVLRTHRVDAAPTYLQVLEDGSGTPVVTMESTSGQATVITCTEDGSSAVLDPSCDLSPVMYGDTSACVPGTCPA
jgi:hypothetical protein